MPSTQASLALPHLPARPAPPISWALPALPVGLLLPAVLLAAWLLATALHLAPAELLPSPLSVYRALAAMAATGELWRHVGVTLARVAAGFLIGAGLGTVLGCLTGTSPLAQRLVDPLVQGLRSVPSIAWVPLFILWLGIAEASKIALIAVGAFFPVYLNLMGAIATVDTKLIDVARVHGLRRFGVLRHVLLPASMHAYVLGLRGGLGLAWMFVAAAELLGASEGLGFLLSDGEQTGRPENVVAAILLFALAGRLSDRALSIGARRALIRGAAS